MHRWTGSETQLQPIHGEPVPVLVSTSPLRDGGGEVVGSVLALRDLVEVTSLRRRLVTSGRLAAVGELAAWVDGTGDPPIARVRRTRTVVFCDAAAASLLAGTAS